MKQVVFTLILLFSCTVNAKNWLLLGEYELNGEVDHSVVDGDTIKVKGLDASIRILFIDTEETFKHKSAKMKTKAVEENWEDYIATQENRVVDKPIKFNTPLGYEATLWARDFFRESPKVRLEYDSYNKRKGFFNRYLAYVFARKNGKWVNFNIEVVKNGYSPYSTKYGRSRRFHNEFVAAQEYAMKHKLGIWNPNKKHYTDYDKRLKWWNERGREIAEYEKKHSRTHLFIGGSRSHYYKLKKMVLKRVKVFSLLKGAEEFSNEFVFELPVKQFVNITVHLSKKSGITLKQLQENKDYYIYVEGILKKEGNKYHIYANDKNSIKFAKPQTKITKKVKKKTIKK